MAIVANYEINIEGRDFVVGDINGNTFSFFSQLAHLNLTEADRVFVTGNVVGYGVGASSSLPLFSHPYIRPVIGYEERAVLNYAARGRRTLPAAVHRWFKHLSTADRQAWVAAIERLPDYIGVESLRYGSVGIGTKIPANFSWKDAVYNEDNEHIDARVMCRAFMNNPRDPSCVNGLDHFFVGGVPVKEVVSNGSISFIDTYNDGQTFTIIQL